MVSAAIKIGLDASCLIPQPLTGVGYYTLHQLRALLSEDRGLEFRLFASSAQAAPEYLRELGRRCEHMRTLRCPTRLKNLAWTQFEWPPIERFVGPVDVAHGCFHLLPAARRAKRMATVFDLSGIRCPHTHSAGDVGLHRRLLRHAVAKADALVAISESSKADLVELLGAAPERVYVVYGGVLLEEFDRDLDGEALAALKARFGITGEYVIHLGTLEPRKNLARLIEAYGRVRARRGECPALVLAGKAGWMYDDVFETIERLGLGDSVIHTGYLERAEAVCLLRGACGCVYPSLYEGFGLPVLEAMAARVPVLTSKVSSLPEVVGDTGLLVDPESVDAIEAGLFELIEERAAGSERATRAYERAQNFTWQRSAAALADVYRAVYAGGAS